MKRARAAMETWKSALRACPEPVDGAASQATHVEERRFSAASRAKRKAGLQAPRSRTIISFAEDADFYFRVRVFLVNIDRQVTELLDQLFQIVWFNLRQVDRNTFLVHRQVRLLQGRGGNQVRQL